MKKLRFPAMALTALACALSFTSCQDDDLDSLGSKYDQQTSIQESAELSLQPPAVDFAEKSVAEHTIDWWSYVLSFNCVNSPLNGAPSLMPVGGLTDPVAFLVGTTTYGSVIRNVEISRNQRILVPIISIINDYPCDDATFKPLPGQSIEEFLQEHAESYIDKVSAISATLDGNPIKITDDNRFQTDLFYFQGNKDLAECTNYCISGEKQAAVSDGYWLMIRGLARGKHVLTVHAEISEYDLLLHTTFNIIVR